MRHTTERNSLIKGEFFSRVMAIKVCGYWREGIYIRTKLLSEGKIEYGNAYL